MPPEPGEPDSTTDETIHLPEPPAPGEPIHTANTADAAHHPAPRTRTPCNPPDPSDHTAARADVEDLPIYRQLMAEFQAGTISRAPAPAPPADDAEPPEDPDPSGHVCCCGGTCESQHPH